MPMSEPEHFGTNSDGSQNVDYCSYCYKNGKFEQDITMDEMIEQCAQYTDGWGIEITKEQAIAQMKEHFPALKRWRGAQ